MNTGTFEQLLPEITEANRPYWRGLAEHELRLECCDRCEEYRFPDSEVCPRCLSGAYRWRTVSGKARLWSWIVMHQRYFSAFDDATPYLVAYVKLDEGPAMISTLADPPAELSVDLPLRAVFEAGPGDRTLLQFAVAQTGSDA